MNNPLVKNIIAILVAGILFYGISALFFAPEAFKGEVIQQEDMQNVEAMAHESKTYYEKDGQPIQWTNSIFSGMPTTMIYQKLKGNLTTHIFNAALLWKDMKSVTIQLFLAMMATFLALLLFGVDWRIALLGGLGFGFGSYNIEIIEAGHVTKMVALSYVALVLASAWYAFNRHALLGSSLFALVIGMQVYSSHYQIVYYTVLMVLVLGIVELIKAIKTQSIANFLKSSALMLVFGLLSLGTNVSKLWTTYEYSKETIRGTSELSAKKGQSGVTKDYAFAWSYGIGESLTLLVPNYKGGGAFQSYQGTKTYKRIIGQIKAGLAKQGITGKDAQKQANTQIGALFYFGEQSYVGMGIYMGVTIFLLMVLGLFLIKGYTKWWLLASALFILSIAWGKHFFLNSVLFDVLPMFNKFRALSMALGVFQAVAIIIAALGLQQFFSKQVSLAEKRKALYWAGGITGGIILLVLLSSGMASYSSPNDANLGPELTKLIHADRMNLVRKDALRSLLVAGIGFGILFSFLRKSFSAMVATILMIVVTFGDMWMIGRRTINPSKFSTPKKTADIFKPRPVDDQLSKDSDSHFRVFDLTGSPFNNAMPAYHHKQIGGYHPAKLMRTQELIEKYLSNPGQNLPIIGMLNGKYIVQNQQTGPVAIPIQEHALGNAWFVQNYQVVETADEVLNGLGNINPREEVLVSRKYASGLEGKTFTYDSTATIRLTKYHPDHMEYEYSANTEQLVVFSEIFYPKGWTLAIGENDIPIINVNHVLRAAVLPSGKNVSLNMDFHPKSFYLGEKISLAASILLLLSLIGGIFFATKNRPSISLFSLPDLDKAVPKKQSKSKGKKPKSKK